MVNALYEKGRNQFLSGAHNWVSGSAGAFGVLLVASTYSVDTVAHTDLNSITTAQRVASNVLAGNSASDGVADTNDVTFSSVADASTVQYIVFFRNGGTDDSGSLILYVDTATGLPLTPNGGDINLAIDSGTCRLFRL